MPPQMLSKTRQDLTRLQTYGSMYLGGIHPAAIEQAYVGQSGLFNQIDSALSGLASPELINKQRDAAIVQTVFSSISIVSSALSSVTQGYSMIVGAVTSIIGIIISAVFRSQSQTACDDPKCLPGHTGTDRQKRHRRAIVGLNTPARSWEVYPRYCHTDAYGGTKSSCQARRALLIAYMNDGMWWWGRSHGDCLGGTIIGVMGRVDRGPTKGCHEDYYDLPYTPKLDGMPDHPKGDRDLSPEFKARQQAVTEVLEWMKDKMTYGLLSCFHNLMHNNPGGVQYQVCPGAVGECNEASIARYMRVPGNRYTFPPDPWADNRRIASRAYASIRGMFQGLVEMSKRVGVERAKRIIASPPVNAPAAADMLPAAIANQKKAQVDQPPWPEKPVASAMTWEQLKSALWELSYIIRTEVLTGMTGGVIGAIISGKSTDPREVDRGYAFDRVMQARYSINTLALSPGGVRPSFWFSLPVWVPYAGAGVLLTGALILLLQPDGGDDE